MHNSPVVYSHYILQKLTSVFKYKYSFRIFLYMISKHKLSFAELIRTCTCIMLLEYGVKSYLRGEVTALFV